MIVVAAGQGTRVGSPTPKQYLSVAGEPVLSRALRPFLSHADVAAIVVVVPQGGPELVPTWLQKLVGDRLRLVAGGASRRESVSRGLAAISDDCTVVLVHDGARPFPPRDAIDGGIAAARAGHAAVPALPVAETLKRADDCGRVLGSVAREGLWRAQTPQAFPRQVLVRAHAQQATHNVTVTDDAMLVELLGERVELLPGSPRNLKITTADDLELAEWWVSR